MPLRTRPSSLLLVVLMTLGVVACRGRVPITAGLSTGGEFPSRTANEQRLELARLTEADAHWVRLELRWDAIQAAGPNAWDWREFDQVARIAEEQGYEVLATVLWTPSWANGGVARNVAPGDPNTYARFVAEAVRRYKSGGPAGTRIRAWEIWNEPNNPPFWAGAPDARAYVDLLRHAYFAVNSVDAHAIVVSGGLAPYGDLNGDPTNGKHPVNFLKAMYWWGVKGTFDALGHHPNAPVPFSPLTDTPGSIGWNAFAYTETLHQLMSSQGDGFKQIWGTETGSATGSCGNCVSEDTQRRWLAEEYLKWRSWWFAGPLFWHAGRDIATGSADADENFGLLRSDFSPKPAFDLAAALW